MGNCLCVRAEQDLDAEDAQQLTRRVSRAWDVRATASSSTLGRGAAADAEGRDAWLLPSKEAARGVNIAFTITTQLRDVSAERKYLSALNDRRTLDARSYADVYQQLSTEAAGTVSLSSTREMNLSDMLFKPDNQFSGGLVGIGLTVGVEQIRGKEDMQNTGSHQAQASIKRWLEHCGWGVGSVTLLTDTPGSEQPTADTIRKKLHTMLKSGADAFWFSYSGLAKEADGDVGISGCDGKLVMLSELRRLQPSAPGAVLNIFLDVTSGTALPPIFSVSYAVPSAINTPAPPRHPQPSLDELNATMAKLEDLEYRRLHLSSIIAELRDELSSAKLDLQHVDEQLLAT
ncbi:hypothetical protein DIPPA_02856 [Diplonema papillatum]|nr:hypothetical protein DIPPA_02856 [Diplonema papillatum]|eukprot:gene22638-34649_t